MPIAFAPRLFHLQLDLVDLFADVLRAFDLCLLRLPDFLVVGVFALQPLDLLLDQREPLFRSFVLFLFDRFALYL